MAPSAVMASYRMSRFMHLYSVTVMSHEADIRLQGKIVATSNDAKEPTTMNMTSCTSHLARVLCTTRIHGRDIGSPREAGPSLSHTERSYTGGIGDLYNRLANTLNCQGGVSHAWTSRHAR